MSAGAFTLALTRTTVQHQVGGATTEQWERATTTVRGGRLQVRVGAATVVDVPVLGVEAQGRRTWQVAADDGSTYLVQRAGGCGCGR